MSNSVYISNLQLEELPRIKEVEKESSSKIDTNSRDHELIKLVMASLTMKETPEEFQLFEIMLEDNNMWRSASPIRRLRILIEELMRRKDSYSLGCAKVLLKYHKDLKSKPNGINEENWIEIRSKFFEILCDYIPSRFENSTRKVPLVNSYKSFLSWAKEIRDSISIDLFTWNDFVREINQEKEYFDFRGRFKANCADFKFLYELCMDLDTRKNQNPTTKLEKCDFPKSEFCGKISQSKDKYFNLEAKDLNVNNMHFTEANLLYQNDYRNIKMKLGQLNFQALMDSGSDSNFLKFEDLIQLLTNKIPLKISACDLNFKDARGRFLLHCSYQIEINAYLDNKDVGNLIFLVPDEKDFQMNILGKNLYQTMMRNVKLSKNHISGENIETLNYIQTHDIRQVNTESNDTYEQVTKDFQIGDIPHKKLWPAEINTPKGEIVTIYRKLDDRRVELAKKALVPLIEKGYVSKVDRYSTWINPVMLVPKSDGRYRFCLDLRGLNELVKQDNYPIPTILNITDCLRNKSIFSKLDIKDGFFHIPLRKSDRIKTSFKIGTETFMFNVLPMGFRNAPNIFQRTMEFVLAEYLEKICIVYIDDILIFSENKEEHKKHLKLCNE